MGSIGCEFVYPIIFERETNIMSFDGMLQNFSKARWKSPFCSLDLCKRFLMVWTALSALPFDCGCYGLIVLCLNRSFT